MTFFFLALLTIARPAFAGGEVSESVQTRIVQLYSEDKCSDIRTIARRVNVARLRPNVMAIAAYCEVPGRDSEALFEKAEALSPTGDLIFFLHAKYRWKKDPASAEPLWQRVLVVARNEYFRGLAQDYLSGVIDPGSKDKPLNLSPTTGFGQFFFGGEHRTNSQPADFVFQPAAPSYGYLMSADLTFRRWYRFGSLATHFESSFERPVSAIQYTLWDNNLEIPVAIHITTNKDLIVRPFAGFSRIGDSPYRLVYGVGMAGAVYRDDYTQSVQGMVFGDRVFVPAISSEEGAHYRFEYQWDLYPRLWTISSNVYVEHVSSTPTSNLYGFTGLFQTSHTDIGVDLKFERDFSRFTVGIAPRAKFRTSSQDSVFFQPSTGQNATKGRQDWDTALQLNATVPLLPSLQLYAWYELHKIFSNLGPGDYVNGSYLDHAAGMGVKTSLSTY